MIDSVFCKICGRPYAPEEIEYCDSCIKDMLWKASKKLKAFIAKNPDNQTVEPTGEQGGKDE